MDKDHTIKIPHVIWEKAAKAAEVNRRSVNGQLIVELMLAYKIAGSTEAKSNG